MFQAHLDSLTFQPHNTSSLTEMKEADSSDVSSVCIREHNYYNMKIQYDDPPTNVISTQSDGIADIERTESGGTTLYLCPSRLFLPFSTPLSTLLTHLPLFSFHPPCLLSQ